MDESPEDLREIFTQITDLNTILKARKRKNGIAYYVPNAMQQRAHLSEAEIILYCGGNRAGKTTMGIVELVWHTTLLYPDWYPKEKRFRGPIKAVVVCDANQKVEKVIEPKLREYMPIDLIKHERMLGGYLNRLVLKNGSTIDFLSSEQDDMAFEGADWDFYLGDEPQKKRKFDAIMRGLIDRGGRTLLTFTPLVEPWMKEHLVDKSDGKTIEAFIVDTYDNQFDIKGNPILLKSNIEKMEAMWDEDTRESRIHGKFFHLRGQVYTEFSEVHQLDFDYEWPNPVICVLDPHDRQPHHVIWAFVDHNDDIYVHTEMSLKGTVEELARAILAHEKFIYTKMTDPNGNQKEIRKGYRVRKRIIDPNFGRSPLVTTGRNFIQEMAHAGCPGWMEGDDPKDEGRLKVKEYLHWNQKKELSLTNRPKLYFHKRNCPLTIRSIRNHQYEEWIGKVADERDPKEKPKDKETHGADVVRYLCMSNPSYDRLTQGSKSYELEESPY